MLRHRTIVALSILPLAQVLAGQSVQRTNEDTNQRIATIGRVVSWLQPSPHGAAVFASQFKQDRISPSDCQASLAKFAQAPAPMADQLRSFLATRPPGEDLQAAKDNSAIQSLLYNEDGLVYLNKYLGGGTALQSNGASEWTYYGNGRRILEVTSLVGANGSALISNQPPDAGKSMWMKGLAMETAQWARFLGTHGQRIGNLYVWTKPLDRGLPLLYDLRFPIWRDLATRAVMVIETDVATGVTIVSISLLDAHGDELVGRRAVAIDDRLQRVSCCTKLPGTTKVFSEHTATILERRVQFHDPLAKLLAARGIDYIIDLTDSSARLYLDRGIPDDILGIGAGLHAAALAAKNVDGAGGSRTSSAPRPGVASMAIIEAFPRNIRIGDLKRDAELDVWLFNASSEHIEIADGGPSCGCIESAIPRGLVPPWTAVKTKVRVRVSHLDRSKNREYLTIICDGPLGRGLVSIELAMDRL